MRAPLVMGLGSSGARASVPVARATEAVDLPRAEDLPAWLFHDEIRRARAEVQLGRTRIVTNREAIFSCVGEASEPNAELVDRVRAFLDAPSVAALPGLPFTGSYDEEDAEAGIEIPLAPGVTICVRYFALMMRLYGPSATWRVPTGHLRGFVHVVVGDRVVACVAQLRSVEAGRP